MSKGLTLITGATGFIATHIVKKALESGYPVRGTVRREEQIEPLKKLFSTYGDKAEFVVVPDVAAPGAFDTALQGVKLVVHTASPLSAQSGDLVKDLVEPTIAGMTNLANALLKFPEVQRVVLTSSVACIIPADETARNSRLDHVYTEEDKNDNITKDTPVNGMADGYFAAKVLAERTAREFVRDHPEAKFDIVTLHPSYVFGPNLLLTSPQGLAGSTSLLWMILTSGIPMPMTLGTVHAEDVGIAHVLALDKEKVQAGERLILSSPTKPWSEVLAYAKGKWPERKWAEQETPSVPLKLSADKADKVLGIEWKSVDEQVDDVVEQMAALGA